MRNIVWCTYFLGVILVSVSAVAQVSAPPQEFWEYMEEYDDDANDLFDPLDYDQILTIDNKHETNGASDLLEVENDPDNQSVKKATMKFTSSVSHSSSSHSSNASSLRSAKGASL